MAATAAYDEIADWYESEFLPRTTPDDSIGVDRCLRDLLGRGEGTCLEIGCGTGVHAASVRALGWTPLGVDLSAGMLRHARGRLVCARADAERLPVRDG
jgi:ubiquinone/menaquinone biosynthesis C-methylase UbiE